VSEGHIQIAKRRIDLFLWLEENENVSTPFLRFTGGDPEHKKQLCALFSIMEQYIQKI